MKRPANIRSYIPKGVLSSRKMLKKISKSISLDDSVCDEKFIKSICPDYGKRNTYEKYNHFGKEVWVRFDLKGRHREHCLCMVCKKLNIDDRKKNCKIANAVFKNCVKFNLVTPMWECPEFEYYKNNGKEEDKVVCCGECD